LRGVPVAALHDGKQYLAEEYGLALTPGLQLLSSSPHSAEKPRTLVAGLAESRQGFSSLPGVAQEVKEISDAVPSQVLLNGDFTRDRLQATIAAAPFSGIHLATHAQFSSKAENTFLLTWDERVNVKNLDQLLRENSDRPRRGPIELLILSACQTAVGDKRATLGLAGLAVRSGARSTLATLWSVQDQSTADLMTNFYKALAQPGVGKAQALRQAQLSLLKSSQYQHPYYWAPFVLVGNWL
jgi:CHAT domain-containing protein